MHWGRHCELKGSRVPWSFGNYRHISWNSSGVSCRLVAGSPEQGLRFSNPGPEEQTGKGTVITEVQRQNNSIPQILVAEDDVPLGNFLRRQLELESYKVKLVQDGELAADAVARDKYHLLILDLNMPKMDGMEVITQVRP